MTQPTPEQLEVAQADRDAAADRLESTIPEKFRNLHPATHTAKAIRKGKMDGHPWVQNYARHRILAIQATEARMAAAVEPVRHWYESDERPPRDTIDILTDIVADLQTDRAEALKSRAAVEAERERCERIASLMQPHPDAAEYEHWRDGFECATVAIAAEIRSQSNG